MEAWAGLKSFKRKDGSDGQIPPDDPGNPTVNFHGEKLEDIPRRRRITLGADLFQNKYLVGAHPARPAPPRTD